MGGILTFNPGSNPIASRWNNQPGEQASTQVLSYTPMLHIKITHFNDDLLCHYKLQVFHFGHKCRKHHTVILPMSCLEQHHKEHLKTPSKTG
jgi:hypothetical protein